MKRTIKNFFGLALFARLVAFLGLGLGLTLPNVARAAAPLAVFEGSDLNGGTLGGYKITLNDGNTYADGVITIGSSSGVSVAKADGTSAFPGLDFTVLVRYSSLPTVESGKYGVMADFCNNRTDGSGKNAIDTLGVAVDSNAKVVGLWLAKSWNGTSKMTTTALSATGSEFKTFAWTQNEGKSGGKVIGPIVYENGTDLSYSGVNQGLGDTANSPKTIMVGGYATNNSSAGASPDNLVNLTGMKISGIAIYSGVMTAAEVSAFTWPSDIVPTHTANVSGTISWNDIAWTGEGAPGSSSICKITLTGNARILLDTDGIAVNKTVFAGGYDAELVYKKSASNLGTIVTTGGLTTKVYPSDTDLAASTAISVPAGETYIFEGPESGTAKTWSGKIDVAAGATVVTRGMLSFSANNNTFAGTSTLLVESGVLNCNCAEKGLGCNMTIAAGAEFQQSTGRAGDALNYGQSLTIDVYGTLNLQATRWTMKSANVVNVYPGAEIKGAGQGSYGALDAAEKVTVNVKKNGGTGGTATISAKLRPRTGTPSFNFNVADGMTLDLSGTDGDNHNGFQKTGAGTLKVTGTYALTGKVSVDAGTLLLTGTALTSGEIAVASGAMLKYESANDMTMANTITGAGAVIKAGTGAWSLTGTLSYTGATTVNAGTLAVTAASATTLSGAVTLNNGGTLKTSGDFTFSSGSNDLKAGSTLRIESGTTVVSSASNKLGGNIVIMEGGTLSANGSDKLAIDSNSRTIDVYGTLNLNSYRWEFKASTVLNVYPGGQVIGTGDSYGALDASANITVNAKKNGSTGGTATISATLRPRNSNNDAFTFNVEDGMELVLSGKFGNPAAGFNKSGAGKLTVASAATYSTSGPIDVTGGTLVLEMVPTTGTITLAAGTTLEPARALTLPTLSGSGRILCTLTAAEIAAGTPVTLFTCTNKGSVSVIVTDDDGNEYTATESSGVYTVDPTAPVPTGKAQIVETGSTYETVEAAFEDVTTGQTVKLLKDASETLTAAETDFTLALDGHTLGGTMAVPTGSAVTLNGVATFNAAVSGTGRVICDGALPVGTDFKTSLQTAATWTGTLELKNYTHPTGTEFGIIRFEQFGNTQSTIALNGVTSTVFNGSNGYLVPTLKAFEICGNGWTTHTGNFTNDPLYNGNLTGNGTLTVKQGGMGMMQIKGDCSAFAGQIVIDAGGHGIALLGSADSCPSTKNTRIFVGANAVANIASGKTWSALSGIEIAGTISGAGTLGSNATFRDGATIDTRNGLLTASGSLAFGAATKIRVTTAPTEIGSTKILAKADAGTSAIDTLVAVYVGTETTPDTSFRYSLAYATDGVYLVAADLADSIAIANGYWSAAATWRNGDIPAADDVVGISGFALTLSENTAALSGVMFGAGDSSITGAYNLSAPVITKDGTGTATIGSTVTDNLTVAVDAGTLKFTTAQTLGAVAVVAGATLDVDAAVNVVALNCAGTLTNSGSNNGSVTVAGPATISGNVSNIGLVSRGGEINLSGATIGANVTYTIDMTHAVIGSTPFTFSDASKYAEVQTVGESDFKIDPVSHKVVYKLCPADKLVWLPIGDSITEGEKDMGHPDAAGSTPATRGGYRYQLYSALTNSGMTVKTVGYRTGHSGTVEDPATCDWAYHAAQYGGCIMHDGNGTHGAAGMNVESTLEVAGYPDVITVLIGINDLSFNGWAANPTNIFTTLDNMASKVAVLRPNSKVLVSTMLPCNGGMERVNQYNQLMRDRSAAHLSPFDKPNVVLADLNDLVFDRLYDSTLFKDTVHPNETGSKLLGQEFANLVAGAAYDIVKVAAEVVEVNNATAGKISVRFNKALASGATATLTLAGTDVDNVAVNLEIAGGAVCATDPRVLEFTVPGGTTLKGGTYTATLSNVSGNDANSIALKATYAVTGTKLVEILGSGSDANVPVGYRDGYVKYETIDIANGANYNGTGPGVTPAEIGTENIVRVGYYVELQRAGQPAQFVWVSMNSSAFGGTVTKIGVPTAANGNVKATATELQVYGNRGNFTNTAVGDFTQTGVVEFSPWTATGTDQNGYPQDFHSGKFGWNDTLGESASGLKGCMQVARATGVSSPDDYTRLAGEMLFAFNNFNCATATDIGIGSFSSHRADTSDNSATPVCDWTDVASGTQFTLFQDTAYTVKKIEIWVATSKKATIDADTTWSALWGGGAPTATDPVELTVTGDATLTIDAAATAGSVKVTSADGDLLTIAGATNLTCDSYDFTAAGKVTFDCTGLTGNTRLLSGTIAGFANIDTTGVNVPEGYKLYADATGVYLTTTRFANNKAVLSYAKGSDNNFHKATYWLMDTNTWQVTGTSYYGDGKAATIIPGQTELLNKSWWIFATKQKYVWPGYVLRLAGTGSEMYADFDPISFGGMFVESGATGWSLTGSSGGGGRATELGDTNGVHETWFVFNESFTVNRYSTKESDKKHSYLRLFGACNFDIAAGKTVSLNAVPDGTSHYTTFPNLDTGTHAQLKMHGEGQIAVTTFNATGAVTLDYLDLANRQNTNPYISGTVAIDDATIIKLPANVAADTPYKMATAITGGTDGLRTFFLGNQQVTKMVEFDAENGTILYRAASAEPSLPSVAWKGDFAAGERRGFTMALPAGVTVAEGKATIGSGTDFITVMPPATLARFSTTVFSAKAPTAGLNNNAVLYGLNATASQDLDTEDGKGLFGILNSFTDSANHAWAMWMGAPALPTSKAPSLNGDLGTLDDTLHFYGDALALAAPQSRFSVDGVTKGNGTGLNHTYVNNAIAYTFGGRTDKTQTATGAEFGSIFIFRDQQLSQDELNLWTAAPVATLANYKHVELSAATTVTKSVKPLSLEVKSALTLTVNNGVTLQTYGGVFANAALTIDISGWTAPGTVISGPIYNKANITVNAPANSEYLLTDDGLVLTKVGETTVHTAIIPAGATTNWSDIVWSPADPGENDDYRLQCAGTCALIVTEPITIGSLALDGNVVIKAADSLYEDGCFEKYVIKGVVTPENVQFGALKAGYVGTYKWVADGIKLLAQNKEVISINIAGGNKDGIQTDASYLVSGTDYVGVAPIPGNSWFNMTNAWTSGSAFAGKSQTITAPKGYIGTTAYPHILATVKLGANNTYFVNKSATYSPLLKGFLDDGSYGTGTNAWFVVEQVPYTKYDVIVYASNDNDEKLFRPIRVNGTQYYAAEDGSATEGTDNWGDASVTEPTFGKNAMIVRDLVSRELSVFGGDNASGGRGGIAAIQIVCTGEVAENLDFTADITGEGTVNWDNGKGTGLEHQNGDWVNAPDATITLTNLATAATLVLNNDIVAQSFKIVSAAGCDLTIVTNGTANVTIAAFDFSEALGQVTFDMCAGAGVITVGNATTLTAKADPVADMIIPNGVHAQIDGITVNRARGEGIFTKTGDGEATLLHGYKATGRAEAEPWGFEVNAGTLNFANVQFIDKFYNLQSRALTINGGTLNLNHVYTHNNPSFRDSGYITDQTITLGSGAVITNGNVTFYGEMSGVNAIRYLGGTNNENEPATFAASIHSSFTDSPRDRYFYIEQGANTADYDLLFSGDIGVTGGQFADSVVHKRGLGTIKVTGARNFPGLVIEQGTWIVAGLVNATHAANAFIEVRSGATIDYATPNTVVLLPTLRGAGTVTHTATGMAARLKFGDTSGFTGTINIPANAVVATPTPIDHDAPFTVQGAGTLYLMLTRTQRGYVEPYALSMKAAVGFQASQIIVCDENGQQITDHVATIDPDTGVISFEPAGNTILYWDNANTQWTNATGTVVAESDITAGNILAAVAGDEVTFNSNVTPLALALPSTGTVTVTNGFHRLGLATIGIDVGATLKVKFPHLTNGDITQYAITNKFGGGGTLELALDTTSGWATSLPVSSANLPSGYATTLKFSAGQFKAASALPNNVTLAVVDGAQLRLTGGIWANTFTLSGNGYGGSSAHDRNALIVDSTATVSSSAHIRTLADDTYAKPSIGAFGNTTISAVFEGTAGMRLRNTDKDGTLTFDNLDYSFAGFDAPVELEYGKFQYGNVSSGSATTRGYRFGNTVRVDSDATLTFKLGQTGPWTLMPELTMNGGTVATVDGNWTFNSVNAAAASTINTGWNKTLTIGELTGAANLTLYRTNAGHGSAVYVIEDGDYTGTLTVGGDDTTYLSILKPYGLALEDASVVAGNGNIQVVTNATIGTLANYAKTISGTGGYTLTLKTASVSGIISGAMCLDIAGPVTLSANNTFTGTLTVKDGGTLTMGGTQCLNSSNAATIDAGGVLDVYGKHSAVDIDITLNGGTLRNTGGNVDTGKRMMSRITLTADSTIDLAYDFGLIASSYDVTTLALDGYTLTKTGSGSFWLVTTTISGSGKLSIDEGTVNVANKGSGSCACADGTFELNGGTLSVDSGKTLTLNGLIRNSGTITNNGTISGLAVLGGVIYPETIGGTVAFADHVTIPVGAVKTSQAIATALAGKVVKAEANTIFMFGDTTTRTAIIDVASTGNIGVVLTAEEYAAYQGTGEFQIDIPCNATAAGEFGGSFYFIHPNGTDVLFTSKSIVAKDSSFVIRATRPTATRKPPFTATVTSNCTWTAAGWLDADNIPVTAEDWAKSSQVNVTLNVGQGADYTVTLDRQISLGTITIVNAGTVRFVKPGDYGITIGTVDDSASTGTTYLHPTDSAYDVKAGANTVMEEANHGGTLTIASGKKATVVYPWNGTLNLQSGYIKYLGDTSSTVLTMQDSLKYSGSTVELAGTNIVDGIFGGDLANTVMVISGDVKTSANSDEVRFTKDVANDRLVLAGGTLTLQNRVGAPAWKNGGASSAIDITGGTLTATGNGFFYPGAANTAGTLTLNISGGTFAAPFNPYVNSWGYRNVVNVSGTGVFAPANLWTSGGSKPTSDDTNTHRTEQTTVNLTGGAFNVPAGVPDWVAVNVNGNATLGIQAGVSRATVRSAVTVATNTTLTVNVPAGQTNEFTQAILGTGNIVKTGGGILMFNGAMPNVGLTIADGVAGFKISGDDLAAYKGGVLELYRSDVTPTPGKLFVADFTTFETLKEMLPIRDMSVKNGKVVISKYKFPLKPTATGAITTTTANWVDSSDTPIAYDTVNDGFGIKIASIEIGDDVAAWTNDVTLLNVGTLKLTNIFNDAIDMANGTDKAMFFDRIEMTLVMDAHFHFDTGAAEIVANMGNEIHFYGSGSGTLALTDTQYGSYYPTATFVSYDDGVDQTYSGIISGEGAVVKEGAGKTYLTGLNTYTGGTTIKGGTLVARTDQALGTGAVVVKAGTMLGKQASKALKCASVTVETGAIVSLREQGTITADQFKITTGSLTLPYEHGENISVFFEIGDVRPDGKWVQTGNWISKSTGFSTVHDVLWENVYGQATSIDNLRTLTSMPLNFSVTDNINSHVIGPEGRVKITQIRLAARVGEKDDGTDRIASVSLTQNGRTVTSASSVKSGTIDVEIVNNLGVYQRTETRDAYVITFTNDYTFTTYQDITMTFSNGINNSGSGMAVIQPCNSKFNYNSTWSPVIEVTGDYTTWQARTFSINFMGSGNYQVTGEYGVVPSDKWVNVAGATGLNGTTVRASDEIASATLTWSSRQGETVSDTRYDNLMRGVLQGNGTGWIKLTGIPFKAYDVVVYQQNIPTGAGAGHTYQFNPPAINGIYYSYDGSQTSMLMNDPALRYGRTNLFTPVEGADGNVVFVKDAFTGDLLIQAAGNPTDGGLYGGIAGIQVVERTDVSVHYATIAAGTSEQDFSKLTWAPEEPQDGFTSVAVLNVTNLSVSTTLTFDRSVTAARINFVSEGDVTIAAIGGEGTVRPDIVKWDSSAVQGTMTHAGDVRNRVEFWLGPDTVFGGTFGGKIAGAPEGAHVHYTKSGIALTAGEIAADVTNHVVNGSIAGDFFSRKDERFYLAVESGNTVTVRPTGTSKTLDLGLVVSGGELLVDSTDKVWTAPRQVYEQTGGLVTFNAQGAGTGSGDSVLLNYTDGADVPTMNISGGTTDVSRTSLYFYGNQTINVSNTGVLKVKGLVVGSGRTDKTHNVNLIDGGTLEIGAGGIPTGLDALKLAGGKLFATDNASVAMPITVTKASQLGAADGCMLVVRGAVTGLANITIANEGSGRVVFMCEQGQTLDVPAGACIGYCEKDINDLGVITIARTESDVALFRKDGTTPITEYTATTNETTIVFQFEVELGGENCWWDYDFNEGSGQLPRSTGTDKKTMKFDNDRPFKNNEYVTNAVTGEVSLRMPARPYRGEGAGSGDDLRYPDIATFVFYATMPSGDTNAVVSFGSEWRPGNNSSKKMLYFKTGEVAKREVYLMYYDNETRGVPLELCKMTVPHMTTAKHLYGVVLRDNEYGNTVVEVYLDGVLWQPYTFNYKVVLGAGFQVAGVHGHDNNNSGNVGYVRMGDSDPSAMEFLRVYNQSLSSDTFAYYAKKYPFVNPIGQWERDTNLELEAGTTHDFDEEGAWYSVTNKTETTNLPTQGTAATLYAEGGETIDLNLKDKLGLESFAIYSTNGVGELTFSRTTETATTTQPSNRVHVSGMTKIMTDVRTKNFALDMDGGNVKVAGGKTLTFDMSSHDLKDYTENVEYLLTGYVDLGEGAEVDYVMPESETNGTVYGVSTLMYYERASGQYHMYVLTRLTYDLQPEGTGETTVTNTWSAMRSLTGEVGGRWSPDLSQASKIWGAGPLWEKITVRVEATNGNSVVAFDGDSDLHFCTVEVSGDKDVTLVTTGTTTVNVGEKRVGDRSTGWYDFEKATGVVKVTYPTGDSEIYLGKTTYLVGGAGCTGALVVEKGIQATVYLEQNWQGTTRVEEGGSLTLITGSTQYTSQLEVQPGSTLTVLTNTTDTAAICVEHSVDLTGVGINAAVFDDADTFEAAGTKTYNLLSANKITNWEKADYSSLTNRGWWTINKTTIGGREVLQATKEKAFYISTNGTATVTDENDGRYSFDLRWLRIKELVPSITDEDYGTPEGRAKVVAALSEEGANHMKVWESIVLGLDSTAVESSFVLKPVQTTSTSKITLAMPKIIPYHGTDWVAITPKVYTKDGNGGWTDVTPAGADAPEYTDESYEFDLPTSGVKYYQIKYEVKHLTPRTTD